MCSLLATGLLVVGCDSGGSGGGSDDGSDDGSSGSSVENTSSVMVEFVSSSSSTNASDDKASAKASGDLTVTFVYQNDSGSDCTLETTDSGINTSGYNEPFDPDPSTYSGSLSSGCGSAADFDGVKAAFEPGSSSSASGLTLRILDEDGAELVSDDDASDGLSASATASSDVTFPDDGDDDSGDDGSGDDGDTTAPNAPSNLSANAGDGTVDLNWDAVSASDLDGYNVYRSTSSNVDVSGTSPLNGSPLSNTSYTDDGAMNGTTYYYVVTAVDGNDNESSASSEVSATPESSTSDVDGSSIPGLFRPSVSAADVNNDDRKDLLVAGEPDGGLRSTGLYLQQSDGTFQKANAGLTEVGSAPATSIADVDEDGDQDLLVVGSKDFINNSATLYLQQSDGSFEPADAGLTGVERAATAIADVDGQNGKDLLISGQSTDGKTTTLYLQQSDGSFEPANADLTGVDLGSASIADFNGDGTKDLLVAGDGPSGSTTLLYTQQSDGSFSETSAGLQDAGNSSTSVADIDNDGDQDLLLAGSSGGNPLADLYEQSGGSLQSTGADLTGAFNAATAIGDANGDDALDLLVAGDVSGTGGEPNTTLYNQQSDGSFQPAQANLPNIENGDAVMEDLNGDGDAELVLAGETDESDHTFTILNDF